MDGFKVNFFVYYAMDKDTSKHALALESYGAFSRCILISRL